MKNLILLILLIITACSDKQKSTIGPTTPEVLTVDLSGDITMDFVWIQSGTFTRGTTEGQKQDLVKKEMWWENWQEMELPAHSVSITEGFYLGKFEVTQEQWQAVMDSKPWEGREYTREGPNYPAMHLSWYDARDFVAKLNSAAGDSLYRLPTEAEWEYACRAGSTTHWSAGNDVEDLATVSWYRGTTTDLDMKYIQPVGTKSPNAWGLYDMHGSVAELCQDWYDLFYYQKAISVDPQGLFFGADRVIRGGSFLSRAANVRSSVRLRVAPRNYTDWTISGVRIVRLRY
jgi:formylglycine-generating enzyme required for sulfatase activity